MKGKLLHLGEDIENLIIQSSEDHLSAYAAEAAFFLLLSVFPFAMLLLTMIGFLPVNSDEIILVLQELLPAEIEDFVISIVRELMGNTKGSILSVSVIVAIWSASRGILAITRGLNVVYQTDESRNYFILRGIAMVHTLIIAICLVLLFVVFVFGNSIYRFVMAQLGHFDSLVDMVLSMRVGVGFVFLLIVFVAVYKGLPNHKIKIRQVLPGALFSAATWLLVSFGFSFYVNHFSNYSNIYGSLTGIAIAMIWMYLMMNLVLWGGELNVYQMKKKNS